MSTSNKPVQLCVFQLHSGVICIGKSRRPVDSIANFNMGRHPLMKKTLTVNKIIVIKELTDGMWERCLDFYKDQDRTLYLLNTNEIINDKPNKRIGQKKRTKQK